MFDDELDSFSNFWIKTSTSLQVFWKLGENLDQQISDMLKKNKVSYHSNNVCEILGREFNWKADDISKDN